MINKIKVYKSLNIITDFLEERLSLNDEKAVKVLMDVTSITHMIVRNVIPKEELYRPLREYAELILSDNANYIVDRYSELFAEDIEKEMAKARSIFEYLVEEAFKDNEFLRGI